MQTISTCLWFDKQAAQASAFYVSLFPNAHILDTKYYLEGAEMPSGSVLTVQFTLNGTEFLALNGGPHFQFSPVISLLVNCETQEEVDALWSRLGEGGTPGQCGWLTDQFGVSWQIVPQKLLRLLNTADKAASQRVFTAMMRMSKLDIAALENAYDGQ